MKYTSAKNIILILIACLLVGGSFVVAEYINRDSKPIYKASDIVASKETEVGQNTDTDGDGLYDWEEILIGTNINNSDTDGDGTTDGREIELKRNPLIKGPKDLASPTNVKDLTQTESNLEPIDMVSRDFFARYMQLKQLGLSNDMESQQELIGKTVDNINLPQPKSYTTAEIITKDDSGAVSIKNYGNEVGLAFKNNIVSSRNEGLIAKEAQEKNDPDILKELDPVIDSYKRIINSLVTIQTPRSLASLHVNLLNAMNSALFTTQSLRKSVIDPISGLAGVGQYSISANMLADSVRALRSYMSFLGIRYVDNEPGYIIFASK